MAIGDVTSVERGSGARFNDGKPDMSLIPLYIVGEAFAHGNGNNALAAALKQLGRFQTTGITTHLELAIQMVSGHWRTCAQVFEYGRNKYAAWNWAKGMPWSAVLACAGRHALAALEGEANDTESGLPHIGHFLCNLVMLRTYIDSYPEGNDLPSPSLFQPTTNTAGNPADPHFA